MGSIRKSLRRQPARLKAKSRILIVCEGRVTEPGYFRGLIKDEEIRLVDVVVDDRGGVPKTLVERAVEMKKEARRQAKLARDEDLAYDEIWCVFDVDEHPNINAALQQATAHQISVAMSNPCFELWLLLHFEECNGWIHRDAAHSTCGKYIVGYKKRVDYSDLRDLVSAASRRASRLQEWQDKRGNARGNPYTTVHVLVDRLRAQGKSQSLKRIEELME